MRETATSSINELFAGNVAQSVRYRTYRMLRAYERFSAQSVRCVRLAAHVLRVDQKGAVFFFEGRL